MRVIPAGGPAPDLETRIVRSVLPVLGPGVEFQIQTVHDIPLDSGGKYRYARSLIASHYEQVPHEQAPPRAANG